MNPGPVCGHSSRIVGETPGAKSARPPKLALKLWVPLANAGTRRVAIPDSLVSAVPRITPASKKVTFPAGCARGVFTIATSIDPEAEGPIEGVNETNTCDAFAGAAKTVTLMGEEALVAKGPLALNVTVMVDVPSLLETELM